MLGSWAYVRAHRAELDHAVAAVIFESGCGRVTGFSLGGRQDLELGVREAFAVAPVDSWGIVHDTYDAPLRADNFDFLLEGVPNLLANREPRRPRPPATHTGQRSENRARHLETQRGHRGRTRICSRGNETPLGRRLSREEVEALVAQDRTRHANEAGRQRGATGKTAAAAGSHDGNRTENARKPIC